MLAYFGQCVRDADAPMCDSGHNDSYMDYHDDTCDQFESWVAGAELVLPALDAATERAERAEAALARVEALAEEWEREADADQYDPCDVAGRAAELREAMAGKP